MKITAISTNYNPTTKAHKMRVDKIKIMKSEEYSQFMKSIDEWTTNELKKIDSSFAPGSKRREEEIEYLFMRRDNAIRTKKEEMLKDCNIPKWRKILVGFGILSY